MSNINISVIIPIFNYSIYLPQCLNSIFNQKLDNIEIILINNSKNNINELIEAYANKFDNIKIINGELNDFKANLNLGIKESLGKYLIFIDSNDYIEEEMFEKLFLLSEDKQLDIAMCNISSMDDLTQDFDYGLYDLSLSIFDDFKKEVFCSEDILNFITEIYPRTFNKLFSKSFLVKNNIVFPEMLFADEVFFYDTFLKAERIAIVHDYLYVLRSNNRFTKDIIIEDFSDIISAFNLIRDKFIENNLWNIYKIKIYNHFIKLILHYFNITSNEFKEHFFSRFKDDFQGLLIEDNVIHKLNANTIMPINNFVTSNSYDELKNKNKKVFSVVIPYYNAEDYIEDAVDSVINQTLGFESFTEIILIDLNSTDNSPNICKEFCEKYPENIKCLDYGIMDFDSARNFGLNYISGKYVNFLDANDTLMDDTFSYAYNFFEEHYNEISLLDYPPYFYGNNYFEYNEEYEKLFSVVIPCYNVEDYIEEAVDSIINQTLDFESCIEIVLVDDGSEDNTPDICKKFVEKYPNNIKFLHQINQGQATARNLGLKYVSGKYVNFLDADDTLTENTFLSAYDFFEQHYDEIDLVAFPMYFFGKKSGNHVLNYKFRKNRVVSLDSFWDYPQLSASSAIFKASLFKRFEFDTDLISSEDSVMVNKILLEKMAYGVMRSGGYNYRKRFDESSTIDSSINDKRYYNARLEGYFCELIDYSKNKIGFVPRFIQYLIVYDIKWMFLDETLFSLLDDDELIEFNKNLRYIFANIEDEVINFHFKKDKYKMKPFMLKLKYDGLCTENNNGIISLTANDQVVDTLNNHNFYIDIVEIHDNSLFISGVLNSYFDRKDFDIVAFKNSKNLNEKYYSNYVSYFTRNESNISESKLCFDLEVPLNSNENVEIQINVVFNYHDEEVIINLPLKFLNHARISEMCNYSIWGDYFVKFENNAFSISKYSYSKFFKSELSMLKKIIRTKGPYWTSAICFHLSYLVLFIFYRKKRIWLIMDRQDRADDNGEHFYNYVKDIDDGVEKYFVLSKDSPDYSRVSSMWKNVLSFYSIKHRILYLFADKIISSQVDEEIVNPFWGKNIKFYSGLLTLDKIFLQHGVAKDDMSTWLRKYDKNVRLLVTSADIEAKSFEDFQYNYADGVVQVLGLTRYDNLSNVSDNKQILIMPTWRRSLINANEEQIKKSEYFLRFNSLINNERFIDLAKSLGYKIIFKPHPNTFEYIDLFDTNDYVIIDDNTGYQELFNNSSLLITDYSSLSFDFAYIKKPIIYYQYGDDYHFGNNFFVFESMGFGEVIKEEDDLVNLIEDYLNNDCKLKDIYLERSNSFYKFNDKNNCKRVYDAIRKIE